MVKLRRGGRSSSSCFDSKRLMELLGGKETISCVVESSLADILFVSFTSPPGKVYQGALIHRSGLDESPPHLENFPLHLKNDNPRDFALESFPTLSRRHTYYEKRSGSSSSSSSSLLPPGKKLGVRLRARQVLCHNCKNVCNEKGENVQQSISNKRAPEKRTSRQSSSSSSIEPNPPFTLVPKIRRLDPKEINKFSETSPEVPAEKPLIKIKLSGNSKPGRALRKKKGTVDSMQDLWDGNALEKEQDETLMSQPEAMVETTSSFNESIKSTPVLKISFGSQQGRGTVMKIPARARNNSNATFDEVFEEGNEENNILEKKGGPTKKESSGAKAAKKALKRARKEAQKRLKSNSPRSVPSPFSGSDHFSPARSPFMSMSPRSITPGSSPAYSVILPPQSPSHNGGRPRNKVIIRRPKHKRKKHKKNKKAEDDEIKNSLPDTTNSPQETPMPPLQDQGRLGELVGQTVDSCMMEDGKTMCVGDVVWGKIDEFPWWPGKVTDIYLKPDVSGEIQPEAKVAWYDLKSDLVSSLLLRAQIKPFKESYQDCFSKTHVAQRYKEAVEAASEEIRLKTVASQPFSSPRPIDCQT